MGPACCQKDHEDRDSNQELHPSREASGGTKARIAPKDGVTGKAKAIQVLDPHKGPSAGHAIWKDSVGEQPPLGPGAPMSLAQVPKVTDKKMKNRSEQLPQQLLVHHVAPFRTHEAKMRDKKVKANPNPELPEEQKATLHLNRQPVIPKESLQHSLQSGPLPHMTAGLGSITSMKIDREAFLGENKSVLDEKYQVMAFVDRGSYGEVKKIRDRVSNTIRALKIINKSKCQMAESSIEEIVILKKLVGFVSDSD